MSRDELTIIDLFAGVGGLSLGFEMEGFHVLLANEYDPSIAEAYIRNRDNPNMIVADIKSLPIKDTFGKYRDKVTVVVGGPRAKDIVKRDNERQSMTIETFCFVISWRWFERFNRSIL